VEDLAGAHGVVEGAQGLLDRGVPVPGVHPQQVDVVGAQPAQAALQRQPQVLAVTARGVGVVPVAAEGELGGQHEPVAAGQHLAEQCLAVAVGRGGVDDVAAGVGVGVDDPPGLRGVGQRHRPEEHLRDPQPGPPEEPVAHASHPRR
jgi:hypothetical protein